MPVNTPNSGLYQAQLTADVVALRSAFDNVVRDNSYIVAQGGVSFLTTPPPNGIGLTAADANVVISVLGNLGALATHYNGGAVAPALNYRANSEPLWGGQ